MPLSAEETRRKADTYKFFKQIWGKTKQEYIKEQQTEGKSLTEAIRNWARLRQQLRDGKVQFPHQHLLDKYLKKTGDPNPYEDWTPEETEEILKQVETAERGYRQDKAKEQQEAYRAKMGDGEAPQKPMVPPKKRKIHETMEATEEQAGGTGGEATGGISAGQGDAKGGAIGGGLAGAGNNTLFERFGRSTKPICPEDYSYTETLTRSFATHTLFPDPDQVWGATIHNESQKFHDDVEAQTLGYATNHYEMEFNHGGVMIPYWIMEASTLPCDWNKPLDHMAYRVEEIGFKIPNLRLSIMNNDKETTNEIAPAPPSDARMWMFVDSNNDYGIPQNYHPAQVAHNDFWREEDILQGNISRYALPNVGYRSLMLDQHMKTQLSRDNRYKYHTANKEYVAADANAAYNLKRHPSYKEFTLNQASLGLTHKCHGPILRLPHAPSNHPTMEWRQQYDIGTANNQSLWGHRGDLTDADAYPGVHQWRTTQNAFTDGKKPLTPTDWITDMAETNWYCTRQPRMDARIKDTYMTEANPQPNTAEQKVRNQWASGDIVPAPPKDIIGENFDIHRRQGGRWDTSDDGKVHMKAVTKRPPLFIIGVHKEIEYKSTKPSVWRYTAFGQVEYFVKIRWYVQPNRYPMYLNVGLGGACDADDDPPAGQDITGRWRNLTTFANLRHTLKPILSSTQYEAPETTGADNVTKINQTMMAY